jgi:hypothetical protein
VTVTVIAVIAFFLALLACADLLSSPDDRRIGLVAPLR